MAKHTLKFFPLGNADTTLIKLANGKAILWDYANVGDPDNKDDKRVNLPEKLDQEVEGDYDTVCFTHADNDHIAGFSEYFYLEHASKYQDYKRKKIKDLWVPAAVLLDTTLEDEAKVLKAEARYRLRNKEGILVFSRPKQLKKWCDDQEDISYDDVKHLFVDAGTLVLRHTLESDGIQFFVHSPFKSDTLEIDRNSEAIVVQATFNDKCKTKLILGSDCTWEIWEDIIKVTRHFENDQTLGWDIFHISHHCSYLSLSDDKGVDKTNPDSEINWLYESQGNKKCRLVSSSKTIPIKGTDADEDKQPPHRQAANYYKSIAEDKNGEFLVTMEEPNKEKPKAIEIEIDTINCSKVIKAVATGASFIGATRTPRAGKKY